MTSSSGVGQAAKASTLWAKYGTRLEKESAAEQLAKRVRAQPVPAPEEAKEEKGDAARLEGEAAQRRSHRLPQLSRGQVLATGSDPRRLQPAEEASLAVLAR
jgi:hypothetical protein